MKVQPLDSNGAVRSGEAKPAGKLRLKRLFERSALRISSENLAVAGDAKDKHVIEPELSSVCLDRMVRNFIEESNNEKPVWCGRNCFNGNFSDSSDDDDDFDIVAAADPPQIAAVEIVKSLVLCASVAERNLLADASKIAEKAKIGKGKDDSRRIVADGLRSLGYDASICKSRWEKTASFPAGEHEYVDVIVGDGERLLVDVDFRSEFEIARSTKTYRAVLQSLPSIFVGRADRLRQIVAVVSESARLSLKKRGLHYPPWRKPEYARAKWLSPYQRLTASGEVEKRAEDPSEETAVVPPWQPPPVKPKAARTKVVTGLACVLREKP